MSRKKDLEKRIEELERLTQQQSKMIDQLLLQNQPQQPLQWWSTSPCIDIVDTCINGKEHEYVDFGNLTTGIPYCKNCGKTKQTHFTITTNNTDGGFIFYN